MIDDTVDLSVAEIAAHWVTIIHGDEQATAKEKEEFVQWLSTCVEHADEYYKALAIWDSIDDALCVDSSGIKNIPSKSNVLPFRSAPIVEQSSSVREKKFWRIGLSVAALLIVFIALSVRVFNTGPESLNFVTQIGEQKEFQLPENSFVNLNTNSSIYFNQNSEARTVEFERGEVYFDIEKDLQRPFTINIKDARITVLGTAFNVKLVDSVLELSVLEGLVSLTHKNQSVELQPGWRAYLNFDTYSVNKSEFDSEQVLSWQQGQFVFHSMLVKDIIKEINRYQTNKILLADPKISKSEISGSIELASIESFFKLIRVSLNVDVEKLNDGSWLIKPQD